MDRSEVLARTKQVSASPAPGAGTVFALRAIGVVLAARWLLSMSQMGYLSSIRAMTSSPWACVNVVLLFLLVVLPGARARAERPLHPLPQWLRQALRMLALLSFVFAVWSVGFYAWEVGGKSALHAVAQTNGWLVVAPALYAVVMWICRPRALWPSNFAARRFAIGRFAVSIDATTRTAVVWAESRKLGQYDSRELSVKFSAERAESADVGRLLNPGKVELIWDSPAAAGHNRKMIFRAKLYGAGSQRAAGALDQVLRG